MHAVFLAYLQLSCNFAIMYVKRTINYTKSACITLQYIVKYLKPAKVRLIHKHQINPLAIVLILLQELVSI